MAFQRSRRSGLASDLCRDAAHAGGIEGADQQDGPQRCTRHRADDAGGALPSGACEDITQSETADAADPSKAAAVEGHRHRERPTRYFAQLRPQGRNGWEGEVRGPYQGACREPPRPGGAGRADAHCPAGATRTDRHPASPFAEAIVRDDEVCRRLMTTPGVGPVVALTYRATVDVPARFRKSKAVGAVFGLTCAKYQSGEVDRNGRISRCGDEMMRVMLYEAAQSMLRSKKWSWLKAWAMQIARRRGMKKAIVALARRLAVIMHRIWVDGTEFRWTREQATAAAA